MSFSTTPRVFCALGKSILFATALLFTVPQFAFAQSTDVTLTASPATVDIGQPISVSYNVATTSFRSYDSIIMVDAPTKRIVASQSVGTSKTGVKTFSTRTPGVYYFQYRATLSRYPIFATSSNVTVKVPDSSLYTLSPAKTLIDSGEPLIVTYAGPAYAHQSGDDIVVIDTATNRQVTSQSLGTSPSGTKTFVLRTPGTYTLQYKLSITGTPVVQTAGPITVKVPDSSLYTLSPAKTLIDSGEPLVVTYAGPAYAHQSGDDIVVIDTATNRQVTSQSLGTSPSGTKTFVLRTPGTYTLQYKLSITGTPVVQTAGPITVKVPDESLFTLNPDITVAEIDQPITVTFSAPAYAHQFGDDILLYEVASGKILSSQTVGSSPSGTKLFRVGAPGTYAFAYRMTISGLPVVKRSAQISVVYVNLSRIANYPLRQGPVIALGDSITYGRDATIGNDYVSLLSARLGETIQNAGVNGDTTTDALERLERDVLSKDPRLVIVFLGGNDFLQKVPTDSIFANLDVILDRIREDGAAVLVLGYKDYFLVNYDARYRDLAWQNGAAYAPDVMGGILGNPFLTTDLVHPRNAGHDIIADRVEPYLRTLLGK